MSVRIPIQTVLDACRNPKQEGDHYRAATCEPSESVANPSLYIKELGNGKLHLFDHKHPEYNEFKILQILGIDVHPGDFDEKDIGPPDFIYKYYGHPHFADRGIVPVMARWNHPKRFERWHWEKTEKGFDREIHNMDGADYILYNLPGLQAADDNEVIWLLEGEKDVDNATKAGILATTFMGGAGNHGLTLDISILNSKKVALYPDNDTLGRTHCLEVAKRIANDVKELKYIEPRLPKEHSDLTDWLEIGGNKDLLAGIYKSTKIFNPTASEDELIAHGIKLGIDTRDSLNVARLFRDTYWPNEALKYYAQEWWQKKGSAYTLIEEGAIEKKLLKWLETKNDINKGRLFVDGKLINSIMVILEKDSFLESYNNPPPCLDAKYLKSHPKTEPENWLIGPTKIYNLDNEKELDEKPSEFTSLFNVNSLVVDYNPKPKCKGEVFQRWLAALGDDDLQNAMQEWTGYLLTPLTLFEKGLLMIGPARSGRGTFGRICSELIGQESVIGGSLSDLAGGFALESFLNKSLAIFGDDELPKGVFVDTSRIVGAIKKITGRDIVPVNRKHLKAVHRRLITRLMVFANRFVPPEDVSGVFMTRFIIIRFTKSYLGKEDPYLAAKLLDEMEYILWWAVEGRKRLLYRGYFKEPESSRTLRGLLENSSSWMRRFVYERCELGENCEVACNLLRSMYNNYVENEIDTKARPLTDSRFGIDLISVCPELDKGQRTLEINPGEKKRVWHYIGIKLKKLEF